MLLVVHSLTPRLEEACERGYRLSTEVLKQETVVIIMEEIMAQTELPLYITTLLILAFRNTIHLISITSPNKRSILTNTNQKSKSQYQGKECQENVFHLSVLHIFIQLFQCCYVHVIGMTEVGWNLR